MFAVQQNDLLVIQAIAAVLAVVVVFANFVVDLLYAVVDPRIRLARSLELMSDMIVTAAADGALPTLTAGRGRDAPTAGGSRRSA